MWRPFLDWVGRAPEDFTWEAPLEIAALPARHLWDAAFLRQHAPGLIVADDRPRASERDFIWVGDRGEAGQVLHGYRSRWLPASLLDNDRQGALVDALFAASRYWNVALHFNQGLAGASADELAAARDTAMNPVVLDAFALAIIAGNSQAAGRPDPAARRDGRAPGRERYQPGDGCVVDRRDTAGIVRRGERFLRARVAAILLGLELPPFGREVALRPRRALLRPPRCRQRALERGRVYESAKRLTALHSSPACRNVRQTAPSGDARCFDF